ncbi:5f45502a-fe6c-4381-baf5-fd308ebb828e [Sclerotinia trifoliorum]|uniref:5f45502a-fe6c-4381-baf5-fd308ebb828e n=1 Tax=Sclerotinia trifoliorum TaxID=28548 RepID=A0A8H2ZQY1_9HELO|nr:5f45502a-fe6c-4381-baf5-fd308ebb828e [Sclerotinia trifoliorum]
MIIPNFLSLLLLSVTVTPSTSSPLPESTQSVTPPPECDVIPTWEVTNFIWFNSSHNLDCVNQVDIPNVCVNSTPNGLTGCDGNLGPCTECGLNACLTGLPLQPAGYGPPDDIKISINTPLEYTSCEQTNPAGFRRYDVGNGIVFCAGVAYRVTFIGDSNPSSAGNVGRIDYEPNYQWACTNGSVIQGSGSVEFEMDCSYDSGNNATCVIPDGENVVIPLLAYQII